MAEYLILNIAFLLTSVTLLGLLKTLKINKTTFYIALILFALTAIFDSLIIMSGIVDYSPSKILGVYIYKAPVEDFFYTLFAVIVIPSVWSLTGKNIDERKD